MWKIDDTLNPLRHTISHFSLPSINIKCCLYQCRKYHCKDKTVFRLSYLHNGISYAGKTTSIYWSRDQVSAMRYFYLMIFSTKASFGLPVLSLPASVCVCVCLCVCQSVCQSLACPRDNSGPFQARITKFGPKIRKTLVKVPIVLGGNWPWPSRSNLT